MLLLVFSEPTKQEIIIRCHFEIKKSDFRGSKFCFRIFDIKITYGNPKSAFDFISKSSIAIYACWKASERCFRNRGNPMEPKIVVWRYFDWRRRLLLVLVFPNPTPSLEPEGVGSYSIFEYVLLNFGKWCKMSKIE